MIGEFADDDGAFTGGPSTLFPTVLVAGLSGLSALRWRILPLREKPAGQQLPHPPPFRDGHPGEEEFQAQEGFRTITPSSGHHLETTDDGNGPKAEVIRSRPQLIPIQKMPFLMRQDVASAWI